MARSRKLNITIASVAALMAVATVFAFSLSRPSPLAQPATLVAVVNVPIKGKLARILVREGDFVRKGQVVALLDSSGYEADLRKAETELERVQNQTQNVIMPIPELSGFLPRHIDLPKVEKVWRKATPSLVVPIRKAEPKPVLPQDDGFKSASLKQQESRASLDKAGKDLALATKAVVEAQKSRDALRPKVGQADVDAIQAAKKADGAPQLLEAGVISKKRAE